MASKIPEKQWAQVIEKTGGPVEYKEIPVQKPGPDEVLINIKYSGVCHTDLHAVNGDWPLATKLPLVGGHEGAGVVVAVGELVDDVKVGDHAGVKWINGTCLSCDFCQQSDEPLCPKALLSGYTVDGTFQQYCIAKAAHVARLHKDIPLDAVAPVLCAGITVYKGLKESGAKPGQTVAIVGAGGGLGSLAQQYARAMGLRVIAIDAGDEKKKMCLEQLGSYAFVDFSASKNVVKDVQAATEDGLGRTITMSYSRQLYYDGKSQQASSKKTFSTVNPATSKAVGDIQQASHSDIDAAISSAEKAFPAWSTTSPMERSRILLKAVALLRQRNDEIAKVETIDTGKPFSETSTVDVVTGADVLEYYANLIASGGLNGETTQLRPDAWIYTTKNPIGVCAGIGAWNYPIQIALWKSAPCLAAGNCMVYKPSEFTPLHAQLLAEVYTEAGVPPGVFNVVQGAGDVGAYLTQHPGIGKVSFTGQVSTGSKVAASAAGGMKYVTMELGGKSPLVILPDCDVESAVDGAMMANFFSTGQVCTNGTRVFVPRSMLPEFEKTLVQKMPNVRSGDVFDPDVNFGPLVSKVHYEKVLSYIRHGVENDKAKLIYGGADKPTLQNADSNGFWVKPTVFTNCTDSMKIVKEEIFGPVLCILPYDTVDEVVKRANDTPMGLAAGVFTKDINSAHKIVAQLQAGILWANTWGESPAEMPVGGWKLSGVGVENGRKGLEAWTKNKSALVEMGGVVGTVFTAKL